MRLRNAMVGALCLSLAAHAQSAEAELERQLKEMVGKPPTKLLVEYEGLDQPNYRLVEVAFLLDGSALPVASLDKLNGDGKHLIFHGDVKPGKHSLEATVVMTDTSAFIMSAESGFKWKVTKQIGFDQQPGLEIQVLITPDLDPGERDPKRKFTLKSTATPKMLAKLEDGSMPAAPKPNLATASDETPDAGEAVAELSSAEKAKLAKAQAAEEKKRKREEAAAARASAAEAKKRKKDEALAAAKAAADEKRRQKAEAAAARKAAAEGKQREPVAVADARPPPSSDGTGPGTPEPKPAELAPPAEVAPQAAPDAGPPAVAAAEAAPAKPASAPPAEEGGLPLPLPVLAGVGVALLGVVIFFATRKRERPPY